MEAWSGNRTHSGARAGAHQGKGACVPWEGVWLSHSGQTVGRAGERRLAGAEEMEWWFA